MAGEMLFTELLPQCLRPVYGQAIVRALSLIHISGVLPVFEDMHDGVRRPLALIAGVVAAGAARPAVFQRPRRGDLRCV